MSWDSADKAIEKLKASARPHWGSYLGFYSSWLDGYYREPWAMMLPLDDHGFHRGDGVFEAVRIHQRAYIDLHAHLRRLQNSAAAIGMQLPKSLADIEAMCVRLAQLCDSSTGILRLYVTRGPGGFSPSPAEVVGHQIYAAITQLKPPSVEAYERGIRAMTSTVAAKEPFWSQIKSCNYLQNVLMKKECLEKGYDFAICLDGNGRVCEGSTENLMIITQKGELMVPRFDYTLRGTTVSLVMKMAEALRGQGLLTDVRLADFGIQDVESAREVAFVGTTLGVLPVNSLDGKSIGVGRAGEACRQLQGMLLERMAADGQLRVAF